MRLVLLVLSLLVPSMHAAIANSEEYKLEVLDEVDVISGQKLNREQAVLNKRVAAWNAAAIKKYKMVETDIVDWSTLSICRGCNKAAAKK